jgi:hypothetical protein
MEKFISDFVKNNTKTIFKDLSLPQKKNLRALIYALFKHQTGLLSELSLNEKILPKNLAQKFSYHLEKVDLKNRVEIFCDRKILKILEKNCVIAYDLSDILKASAKKIEGLGKVFDGSQRKVGTGFFLHGVGVMGILWRLEIHDGDRAFLSQVRKKILEKLISLTKKFDPIFALDRGNDDKKLFEFLIQKNAKFIIRIKKNRKVILAKTGEVVSIERLALGRYKILLKTEKTTQKKFPKYQRYLVIVSKNKNVKTPIRLICSPDMKNFSNKEIVGFYLQRWGLENSFKQIKQGLNLEKIRVLSLKKFQNLVSLMHLCSLLNDFLLRKLKENAKKFINQKLNQLWVLYEKFKKKYCRNTNPHSFLKFLATIIPEFSVHRKFPKPCSQISLFRFINEKLRVS